jgi:hypothetical protein
MNERPDEARDGDFNRGGPRLRGLGRRHCRGCGQYGWPLSGRLQVLTWKRKMLTALVLLCSIGTTDCRQIAESPDQTELPFMCLTLRHGGGSQTPGAGRQVRQGGMRPQERPPNYRVVAAWSGLLLFIGAGAFALGMAIHNEALAQQHTPRPEPIYYCATGVEFSAFEPCKEMKDQRVI